MRTIALCANAPPAAGEREGVPKGWIRFHRKPAVFVEIGPDGVATLHAYLSGSDTVSTDGRAARKLAQALSDAANCVEHINGGIPG